MSTGTSNTNTSVFDHSPQHRLPGTKNAFCSSLPLPYNVTYPMDPCLEETLRFVSSQSFPVNTFTVGSLQKFSEVWLTLQIRVKNMHCLPGQSNSAPQPAALPQPSALHWFLGIMFCVDKMHLVSPSMGCCIRSIHCNTKPSGIMVRNIGIKYVSVYSGIPKL